MANMTSAAETKPNANGPAIAYKATPMKLGSHSLRRAAIGIDSAVRPLLKNT